MNFLFHSDNMDCKQVEVDKVHKDLEVDTDKDGMDMEMDYEDLC